MRSIRWRNRSEFRHGTKRNQLIFSLAKWAKELLDYRLIKETVGVHREPPRAGSITLPLTSATTTGFQWYRSLVARELGKVKQMNGLIGRTICSHINDPFPCGNQIVNNHLAPLGPGRPDNQSGG